ncbi:hypothetical protein ACFVIM_16055, partial [Streptomyces sp. NPDC057638]|uniref:HAAS signaling domain-containing protein n=1 Tax=Streptomyces sp. NPDC057638 TaxID=3346190 RepID=UPI0036A89F0B
MGIESDQLVYDYLSRVGDLAQRHKLNPRVRAELVAALRGEIDRERARQTTPDGPAAVRKILKRLGTPEEVVASAGPGRPEGRLQTAEPPHPAPLAEPAAPPAPAPPPAASPSAPGAGSPLTGGFPWGGSVNSVLGSTTATDALRRLRDRLPRPRTESPPSPVNGTDTGPGAETRGGTDGTRETPLPAGPRRTDGPRPPAPRTAPGLFVKQPPAPPESTAPTTPTDDDEKETDWWSAPPRPVGAGDTVGGFSGGVEVPEILLPAP